MKRLHIMLVESSPLFRQALTSALRSLGFSVAILSPRDPAPKQVEGTDVVLVDVATFSESPQELEELVKLLAGVAPVLLLARQDRIGELITGLKAGATGLITQTASTKDLKKAITALAEGGTWFDRQLFGRIIKFVPIPSPSRKVKLSKREEDVLKSISLGRTNKEIAQDLNVSEQSVKVYVSNLLRKTGAPNRSNLALLAVAQGFVASS